jgi:predicted chitinase
MSLWENFLENVEALNPFVSHTPKPGKVMVCFMNRYLEGLDDVKYKLVYDGKTTVEGKTSETDYCFELAPQTTSPIEVFVWSQKNKVYKRLEDVQPVIGKKVLARKIIKTIKTHGTTRPHKDEDTDTSVPKRTEPTKAAPPGPSPQGKQGVETTSKKDEQNKPIDQLKRAVPDGVTKEQLKKIFPQAKEDYLQQIADEVNTDPVKYQLDTAKRRAHFFGQIRQEAGPAADSTEENLNYAPSVLLDKFSYYGRNRAEAAQDGYTKDASGKIIKRADQKAIANKAYGPPRNGNTEPDDGWRFRGRGLKQLTGRGNYKEFRDRYSTYWNNGYQDFLVNSDVVKDLPYSLRSAIWFWLANDCATLADKGISDADVDAVSYKVNPGELKKNYDGSFTVGEKSPAKQRRFYTNLAYLAFI